MGFNMFKEMTKEIKKEVTEQRGKAQIVYIAVEKLIPSEDNFYSVVDVGDLMDSIELVGGITQNLTVTKIPDTDTYKIIEGHRRREACRRLVAEGKTQFANVPCVIKKAALTDYEKILEEMQLIYSNSTTRQLSDYEKTQQVTRLKELLKQLKKEGIKINGRTREIIAGALDTSTAQVGRMESINRKLSPEFKQEFKDKNIGVSVAYELSTIPKEKQEQVFNDYKVKGELSIKDVKTQREPPQKDISQTAATVHNLKIFTEYFNAIKSGIKKFEYRRNDRGYQLGNVLQLNEWIPQSGEYTGRTITAVVTYILAGQSLPPDYVIMSIDVLEVEG